MVIDAINQGFEKIYIPEKNYHEVENLNCKILTAQTHITDQKLTIGNLENECKEKQKDLLVISEENTDLRKIYWKQIH